MTDQPFRLVWPNGQQHQADYQAKGGSILGTELLRMVGVATRAILPELTRNSKSALAARRDKAVDTHVQEWGRLIAKKHSSQAYVGAQEPDAPKMDTTASGFSVNYAYWLSSGSYDAKSYPAIARSISKEGLSTYDVRAWFNGLKKGGSELLRLVGESAFGAEVGRNPRVFASHLMMYDLLETGGAPRENPDGLTVSLADLYDMANNLEGTHGALPMMGQDTYAQGRLGITATNPVHRKEAIAISTWLRRKQGASGEAFTRDQVFELLLRRLCTFGGLSTIAIPTEAEAQGSEQAVIASNLRADDEEAADKAVLAKQGALRAARESLATETRQLETAERELLKERGAAKPDPNRVQLRTMSVNSVKKRRDEAQQWLDKLIAEAEAVPQPVVVAQVPAAVVQPVVQPVAQPLAQPLVQPLVQAPAQPPAADDVDMAVDRKRKAENQGTGSNAKQPRKNEVV